MLAVAGFVGSAVLSPAVTLRPPVAPGGLSLITDAHEASGGAGGGRPLTVWLVALVSGLAEAAYCGLLVAAYARGSLAVTYPVGRGSAPLLVTLGAWAVLGQRPSGVALAGAVALAAGLVLVAGVAHGLGQHRAVGWAVAVGVAVATYSVLDAVAVRRLAEGEPGGAAAGTASPLAVAGYLGVVMFLQGVVLTGAVRSWSRLRAALRRGALVGIGVVTAYLLVLLAFQRRRCRSCRDPARVVRAPRRGADARDTSRDRLARCGPRRARGRPRRGVAAVRRDGLRRPSPRAPPAGAASPADGRGRARPTRRRRRPPR